MREPFLRWLVLTGLLGVLRLGKILRLHQSEMDQWIEGQDDPDTWSDSNVPELEPAGIDARKNR